MSKPMKFKSGDHWVECQRCGFVYRESRMREEWTGLIVCGKCWEPRHPQEFIKGLSDDQTPDGLENSESSDTFKDEPFDTSYRTSIPEGTFTPISWITDNLVVWYKFEEGTGLTATDSSDAGNDGTLMGDTSWTTGIHSDGGIEMDGSSDAVNTGVTDFGGGADSTFSICAWVNGPDINNLGYIASKFSSTGEDERQWRLLALDVTGQLRCDVYWTQSDYRRIETTGAAITEGDNVHIAMTYDGSVDTNDGMDRFKFYANGQEIPASIQLSSGDLGDMYDGGAPLAVGSGSLTTGGEIGSVISWEGILDDFRAYTDVLTAAEVEAIFRRRG